MRWHRHVQPGRPVSSGVSQKELSKKQSNDFRTLGGVGFGRASHDKFWAPAKISTVRQLFPAPDAYQWAIGGLATRSLGGRRDRGKSSKSQ